MFNRTVLLFAASALLLLPVAGCGNKGALYLPDSTPRPEGAPTEPGDESEIATIPDNQGDSDEDDDL